MKTLFVINPRWQPIFISLLLPLVALACIFPGGMGMGGSESSPPDIVQVTPISDKTPAMLNAENFIWAIAADDLILAAQYACPREQVNLAAGVFAWDMADDIRILNVACYPEGDNMRCDFASSVPGVEGTMENSILFEMEGDLVCGAAQ